MGIPLIASTLEAPVLPWVTVMTSPTGGFYVPPDLAKSLYYDSVVGPSKTRLVHTSGESLVFTSTDLKIDVKAW